MFVARFRRAVASRDEGAVALIVAISALVLFGASALAIDIGQMQVRRAAAQLDADLAALAGAQALPNAALARQLAYNYIDENFPSSSESIAAIGTYDDNNLDNGEIDILNNNTRIKVYAPRTTVNFGMAGALGFSSSTVLAVATAEIQSPAKLSPFMVSEAAAAGYLCLKDRAPGGGNPSPLRAALYAAPAPKPPDVTSIDPTSGSTAGGTAFTIKGTDFDGAFAPTFDGVAAPNYAVSGNGKQITGTTPAHAAGPVTVTVTTANGSDTVGYTYVTPPPTPGPTVTGLSPSSGVSTGGTSVTITGTNLTGATAVTFEGVAATSFVVNSATQITAVSPAGSPGIADVLVTTPGGTSTDTTADDFTYITDSCSGANGNFSFLDIPRTDVNGTDDTLTVNIIDGVEKTISTYPTAQLPAIDQKCWQGNSGEPGAIEDVNCLQVETGNKMSVAVTAYLDGINNPNLDGKLHDPPSGHDSGPIFGRTDKDIDHIDDYLTVPLAQFVTATLDPNATPVPGWLDSSIVECPRFSIVPVLHTTQNPQSGAYAVVGFRGVFIDGPAPDYGFQPNNNNTQIESIKAYAFSLDYLPGILSSSEVGGDTTTYIGSGPKVPVLIE